MPQKTCCVPGCSVTTYDGVTLHNFPDPEKNSKKFNVWVANIYGDLATLDATTNFIKRRVCHNHFEDVHKYPKNRLSQLAMPVLHLPERARTETDSEFSERARTETDSESSEDENLIMKCCVPGCKDLTDSSSTRHLHSFPNPITDRERYRKWMLAIYGENADDTDEHKVRRICTSHFEAKYHCRFGRLSNNAIPTLNLSESDNELKCSDVEYLDEDLEDDFDLADPLKESLDKEQPTIAAKLEQDFKTALDEIDLLFLSYAKTFRTLSKQFQTMLKLDMAKLFTRYEIKNDMLSKSKEENQDTVPVELTLPVEETSKPSTLLPKDPKKVFLRQVPLKTVISSLTNIRTYSKSTPKIRILNETKLQSKDITEKSSVVEVVPTKLKPIYKKPKLKPTSPDPISTHESIITIDENNEDETTINEMHTQNEDDPELMMEVTDPIKTETVFVFSDDMVKIVDKT